MSLSKSKCWDVAVGVDQSHQKSNTLNNIRTADTSDKLENSPVSPKDLLLVSLFFSATHLNVCTFSASVKYDHIYSKRVGYLSLLYSEQ